MELLDWAIVCLYLSGIVVMSLRVGRAQASQEDYYLGGRKIGHWAIALSILATQSSAISLLGTPAFVALKPGGGMLWLQYEFAVPLAMAVLISFFIPVFYRLSITTIYEYLEERFGPTARLVLASVFLLGRSLATGVSLYATAIVLSVPLGTSLSNTLLLVGGIAILYTTIGGIKADIYSDIIQLIILWIGTLVLVASVWNALGDEGYAVSNIPVERVQVFDWSHHGMGDGKTYAFWPMLLGGFFLYLSYYGCDQSQAQRLLTAPGPPVVQKALFLNGLLRFPLVLTQCVLGLLLASYITQNPDFLKEIPQGNPDFLVPTFLTSHVMTGLRGIIMASLLAAAMSSLDSALNSLSAVTLRDFGRYFRNGNIVLPHELSLARGLTVAWGILCTLIGFLFSKSSSTVIELVNMAGSLFYGPVLGVFLLGILTSRTKERGVVAGLILGVLGNLFLWRYLPGVSWLWWNPVGCLLTVIFGGGISLLWEGPKTMHLQEWSLKDNFFRLPAVYCLLLLVFFVFTIVSSLWLEGSIRRAILLD